MKPGRLLEERLLCLILALQTALVCVGVLSRYAFGWSLSFTEELTRYLLVWLACLGFSACWARGEMIGFEWPGRRSQRLTVWIARIRRGAVSLFFLLLLFSSWKMMALQWRYHQTTSVMGWPILWVSLALPTACVLTGYRMWGRK